MDDESGGLFNIDVDDSEDSANEPEKVPRDFQSEEVFQQQRKEWKPKTEVGELWESLKLPIDNPSKPQAQMILHSIEELYFFRRYEKAKKVAEDTLKGKLNEDFRQTVIGYMRRCEAKLSNA